MAAELNALLQKEDEFMAAEGYSKDEQSKNRRLSAVNLTRKIWMSHGRGDTAILYLALNYYDRLVSRNEIPVVDSNVEKNQNLFVVFCFTIASMLRIKNFELSEFLENHDVEQHKAHLINMTDGIRVGLANMKVTITPMHFTEHFVLKLLQQSHSKHEDKTRRFANLLIVKSQAEIAMTAFKPSVVAASAVLVVFSKLFPTENYDTVMTRLLENNIVSQGSLTECTKEIIKWSGELGCTPLRTGLASIVEEVNEDPDIDDFDKMKLDFDLRWYGVEGVRSDNSAENEPRDGGFLVSLISCFRLNKP